ncbi:MAG: xanthine dehydrogenase family protein molybdopterin-binding subunit [Alphaproteobacteria bacterium]|nr:xanthine dehydrogenase family protein molybdopterin-binding subunit [Alphaproteobacteria bacterium]
MADTGIGASVRRKEDQRFITGRGHYTDDLNRPGQAYAFFVRSPHAHARIKSVNTAAAARSPGVIGVFTGQDVAADKLGSIPCGWGVTQKDGKPMNAPPHMPLAADKARYVGDQVALVVAETYNQARDAAEKVVVDYEVLPASVDLAATAKKGAPVIHDQAPNNVCFVWGLGDEAATKAAFAKAHHVAKLNLVNNRVIPNAIEPRAAIGDFDTGDDSYTLYVTSQNPHLARLVISAFVQIAPESKLRVVAPDVGGGFGSKIFIYAEECVVTWASRKVGRPVKWTAERFESFLSDAHGRDHLTHVELALDKDGKFLGLRVDTTANMGAYLSNFASAIPTYLYGTLLQGVYTTAAIYCEVTSVFTNTVPVDAVRGAGRPEATYLIERIVDVAASDMGIDRAEIRRRNFIAAIAFPYQTQVALQYDSGNYGASLEKALTMIDYAGFEKRRKEAAGRGKLRGIGLASYIEACGIAPSQVVGSLGAGVGLYEAGQVRFDATGNVTVFTGSHTHGQSHETTFAQIVSDYLGVPFEKIEVVHGDSGRIPFGMGTYGSRSLAVGGSAIVRAMDKVIAKGRRIAAHLLEASEADIEFKAGKFSVKGTDRAKTIGEIAFAAYVPHNYPLSELEPGLDETAFYDPANFTFPAGTHVCEVEIDRDTGVVAVERWVAVDDFGRIINPMVVAGQVQGGVAHGVGQALCEAAVYDKSGQLLTGSYMDYCMPRAGDLPSIEVDTTVTLCTHNPLGVKGCGETGAIAAPATLINAIVDALAPLGVKHIEMPATSQRVWQAIHSAS